jgi:prepilin-type N-terminal cleavage/methylation domain-containing protein
MKKLRSDNRGFTLVEMLIVLLIVGVISSAVYGLFQVSQRYNQSVMAINDYENLVSESMYKLRVELADASDAQMVDIPDINTYTYNDDYNYIIPKASGGFVIRKKDSSGVPYFETVGEVNANLPEDERNYKLDVKFTHLQDLTGYLSIKMSMVMLEDPDAPGQYAVITDIGLRSSASGNDDSYNAIQYKVPS